MPADIIAIKSGISRKYLGRNGIHACGIQAGRFITVYYSPDKPLMPSLKKQILTDAEPFEVKFIESNIAHAC